MASPIDLPLDEDDARLIDPPAVDFLHYDSDRGAYAITFVPSGPVSDEPTEVVVVGPDDATAAAFRRIDALMGELSRVIGAGSRIVRLSNQGADDYSLHFADGGVTEAFAAIPGGARVPAVELLKQIALTAEAAYVARSRSEPAREPK